MTKIRLQSAAGWATIAVLLGACAGQTPPAEQRTERALLGQGDIVVATPWPWQAHGSIRYGEGLQLALEEINAAGGVRGRQLKLLRVDDRESVNDGRLIAQRLAQDPDVMAVIGHLQSHVTVPAAAIYDRAQLLLIAPAATDVELTSKGYTRVFRTTFTDADIGAQMADIAAARGHRRVAIYYVRSAYGRAMANAFEEHATARGLTISTRDSYDAGYDGGEAGGEGVLRELQRQQPDAVFLAAEVPMAGRFIKQLRAYGIKAAVLGSDAMSSPELITVGGPAVEGTIVTASYHPAETRAEVQRFSSVFRTRFGVAADAGSALGYDALKLLAHAMTRARSPAPEHVAQSLRTLRNWPGVTGRFTFDDTGTLLEREGVTLIVRDGRFQLLERADIAHVR
jgi:branched-chain amino acid transport system substrate-binding protein